MAENVRVVVRCRPLNSKEHDLKCAKITRVENCTLFILNPSDSSAPAKAFTYDNVYDELAPTESVYNDVCYSLVDNVLDGYNGTIFAYGQTGCGKTHTMHGPDINDIPEVPNSQRGIITRSFDHIFEAISVASGVHYLALVSYLEIYNETIRDLLSSPEAFNTSHALKELPGIGVTVPTLSTHMVHNSKECETLLTNGNRNRKNAITLMNSSSSRSHSIFTISLEQIQNKYDDDVIDTVLEDVSLSRIRRGKLNLVDLAGSERQYKTGASGERLKEATKINLSLSALGNVISALVDGKTKHIPYRDSKLTRLLQDSLGGNTKTLMIACISPADYNYVETISTLRYAARAKNISNKPKINEDPKDAKLREYQDEIIKLKKLLDDTNIKLSLQNIPLVNHGPVEHEKQIEEKLELLELDQRKHDHEKHVHDIEHLRNHYEEKIKNLTANNLEQELVHLNDTPTSDNVTSADIIQLEAKKRIEAIKQKLIGGECANDIQLKERRQRKKIDAQRRLSALAHALSRVEQSEDRDLLQGHYTNIQQEITEKNEYLKLYRQKIKTLEQEISDLQAEFQLDRADYLESIRRLDRNLKFYQQLMDKAIPILRKDGKYWDADEIIRKSFWNDDLKIWKLPESSMSSFKLPLAANSAVNLSHRSVSISPSSQHEQDMDENWNQQSKKCLQNADENANTTYIDNENILKNYFRSHRQRKSAVISNRKTADYWKDLTEHNKGNQQGNQIEHSFKWNKVHALIQQPRKMTLFPEETSDKNSDLKNSNTWSYPLQTVDKSNDANLNKTWCGSSNSEVGKHRLFSLKNLQQ